MSRSPWDYCLENLKSDLPSKQFNTWIRPLQVQEENSNILIFAPNEFVKEWVDTHYQEKINTLLSQKECFSHYSISLQVGCKDKEDHESPPQTTPKNQVINKNYRQATRLNPAFTFTSFVSGKSNELARAASMQVGDNPGESYNPLFIYGDVGLGKTHLMHAVGNMIISRKYGHVIYLHSEKFVSDMVKALQHNSIDKFKHYYRSADALLIDDIQFFAKKEHSQEEFFHTFNALMEEQRQIILTCDRSPKEVSGLEDRLKSRFGCGLTVAISPPELETRVAIIKSKAATKNIEIPDTVSFFIANRFRSNVRELEGALNRVVASSKLTQQPITIEFTKETLKDLLRTQDKLVTIENIQKITSEYYNIRITDLLSKKRNRHFSRPRQIAMKLSKELTSHSLPEIGNAFGGRDHSTVLHACRRIDALKSMETKIDEDYNNLMKTISN